MPPGGLVRRDQAEVGGLVVRIPLEHPEVVPRRGVRVAAGEGVRREGPHELGVDGAGLLPEADRPVLVRVLLEEVARVDGLDRGQALVGVRAAGPPPVERVARRDEERVDVEREVRDLEPERRAVGSDEVVGSVALVRGRAPSAPC